MTALINNRPTFFCVGAAKSGTTALHNYLRQHPDIYMPIKKEIHHFAPDLLKADDFWLNMEKYLSLFRKAKSCQIIGETSVLYLLSEKSATEIKKFEPEAKVIIILRNPIEVIKSRHTQLVFNGEENITDFEETLKIEEERKLGKNLPPNTRIIKKHLPLYSVSFAEQTERFMNVFDKSQLSIVIYDDFIANPIEEIKKLYKFLGVDDSFTPTLKTVNARKKVKSRKLQNGFKAFSNKILERFLDENQVEAFRLWLENINSVYVEPEKMKPETRAMLTQKLKPEIEKLSTLLNRDLSHWLNN